MTIDEAHFADESAGLLRRWLAETHTSVGDTAVETGIGPFRIRAEVTYRSAVGAHGFGMIYVLGSDHEPIAVADPRVLALACAKAASDRAVNGEVSETTVDSALPPGTSAGDSAPGFRDPAGANRWIASYVDTVLAGAFPLADRDSLENLTIAHLTRRLLPVIGAAGRQGVAEETELLASLAESLRELAAGHPEAAEPVKWWLTRPTLPDVAQLNPPGGRYEIPNPLLALNNSAEDVPGVPMPVLDADWSLRPVVVGDGDGGPDVRLVYRWMHAEHVAPKWLQAWSLQRWRSELIRQLSGQHSLPCIVSYRGREVGYVELYRVVRDKLAECYPWHPRDLGVHIAIGEADVIGQGLGSSLLRALASGLLRADPECRRVVAEPDVHNGSSIAAFRKAGFVRRANVGLPAKNSALMVFSR